MSEKIKRPSLVLFVSEPIRALTELASYVPYKSFKKNVPKGDGHAVLVLPGFMGSKLSTSVLRRFLSRLNYRTYDWNLGRNLGKVEYLEALIRQVEDIHQESKQPVSIIGWSLGGVFARQIAKERPHLIRQVITLGSPFAGITEPNNAEWFYRIISKGKKAKDIDQKLLSSFPIPANVPTTAVYSKEDGVVPWKTCLEKEDDIHQNIQVRGSHFGLGVNPIVLSIIADRLIYTKENWVRYEAPKGSISKLFYPSLSIIGL